MKSLRIADGKVFDANGVLLGDLDYIDEATNTVYIKGDAPEEIEKLALDLKKAVADKAKQPFADVSYQILNQGPRPKRNGPCPAHPKIKFKNCPCSRKDWNINIKKHEK